MRFIRVASIVAGLSIAGLGCRPVVAAETVTFRVQALTPSGWTAVVHVEDAPPECDVFVTPDPIVLVPRGPPVPDVTWPLHVRELSRACDSLELTLSSYWRIARRPDPHGLTIPAGEYDVYVIHAARSHVTWPDELARSHAGVLVMDEAMHLFLSQLPPRASRGERQRGARRARADRSRNRE